MYKHRAKGHDPLETHFSFTQFSNLYVYIFVFIVWLLFFDYFVQESGGVHFQAVLLRQEDTDDAAYALQPGQSDAD